MADFLTTAAVSERLENIIKDATEELVLISPYLKVNDRIRESLENKAREFLDEEEGTLARVKNLILGETEKEQKRIQIVYGKEIDQPEVRTWLASSSSIEILFRKNLHAKCYLNETEALLTSMNLYEFSQQNNDEMGILVSRKHDRELYDDIHEDAIRILDGSEEVALVAGAEPRMPKMPGRVPERGFCIRCRVDLAANPVKPYCDKHFQSWNRYKNPEYKEEYCHICGDAFQATLLKPLCSKCYRRHNRSFEFAS